jgi:hypothetical protein
MDRVFRGIGSFSVKFRWFIIAAWVITAVAVAHFLPSLASVTQGNNANFLPASAPSEHAATLAKPFGGSNEVPVLVLAARSSAPLSSSDQTWLASEGRKRGTATAAITQAAMMNQRNFTEKEPIPRKTLSICTRARVREAG